MFRGGEIGCQIKGAILLARHYTEIQNWCANCSNCIARKTTPPHRRAPLQPVQVGYPLEMVAVNIMGPFPKNVNGNCYILATLPNG